MPPGLALFRRFPGLAERLPRRPLLTGPTPVSRATGPGGAAPDGVELWIKHDERSTPVYGGNKPRKLEFVIGDALARGARRLVTSGGLGTNHGLATALLGREAGLATTLLLVHQPVTDAVRRQLLLLHAAGARLRYGGGLAGAVREGVLELMRDVWAGERPCIVPTGGSSPRGNLGFVSAGLELAEQVKAGELPEPERVFVPVGTGGTLVGLVVGLRLAGLRTRGVGVLVTDILPPSPARLARQANATVRLLRRHAPECDALRIAPGDFDWVADQVGPGYGAPTPAAREAVAAAAGMGLTLETTYTGKALAALREAADRGILGGPTLFWNTYSAVDVAAALAPLPEPSELPAAFQRFFGGGTER
jgi:D-cysteine desulfhydrase